MRFRAAAAAANFGCSNTNAKAPIDETALANQKFKIKRDHLLYSALLCSAAYAVITLIWRTNSFIWISEFNSATTAGLIETDEIISRESYSY